MRRKTHVFHEFPVCPPASGLGASRAPFSSYGGASLNSHSIDAIEFVDHTGNANGFDHLHFEIRLGGPNGTRIDPRPTLDAASCR